MTARVQWRTRNGEENHPQPRRQLHGCIDRSAQHTRGTAAHAQTLTTELSCVVATSGSSADV
eukprot:6663624-Karenia_brevis.AAC.1